MSAGLWRSLYTSVSVIALKHTLRLRSSSSCIKHSDNEGKSGRKGCPKGQVIAKGWGVYEDDNEDDNKGISVTVIALKLTLRLRSCSCIEHRDNHRQSECQGQAENVRLLIRHVGEMSVQITLKTTIRDMQYVPVIALKHTIRSRSLSSCVT